MSESSHPPPQLPQLPQLPPPQATETDESFDAEVSDLRDADRRTMRRLAFWSAHPLAGKGLSPRQRLVRGMSAAATVVLALLAITASVRGLPNLHLFERQPPQPTTLRVSSGAMSFLEDMAWSPDGKHIALLGCLNTQVGPCDDSQNYVPNTVLIYDAASGKLLARIHPDGPVLDELHALDPTGVRAQPPASAATPATPATPAPTLTDMQVVYSQVLWSPDGRRLALMFQANVPPRVGQTNFWNGVVLVDSDGTHAQALFNPILASALYPTSAFYVWDLATETPALLGSMSGQYSPLALSSAMAYRWGANGTLMLETPLIPNVVPPAPPLAPIGNPDGGTSFTSWQPGTVAPVRSDDPALPSTPPSAYTFSLASAAWSPNGRWLVGQDDLGASAVLVPQGGLPPALPPGFSGPVQPGQLDYLPVRDKALQQLLDLGPVPNVAESGWDVAWRPDGRVLATYGISTAPDSPHPVLLYDCATGRKLAALQPLPGSNFLDGFNGGILR